jgi:hypothetical protein
VNPKIPPQKWPPGDDDEITFRDGIGYDEIGRIVEVPAGWEVEFTGTVSGYSGGLGNPISEERITLLGAPGEISEKDLMEQYKIEGHPAVYWGGSEVLELSSFSERAVEKEIEEE